VVRFVLFALVLALGSAGAVWADGDGWRPNDPLYAKQGYLGAIGIEQAWATQRGSPYVIVAVVDSGVDITQPDLQGAIWQDDGSRPLPADCGAHGCNTLDLAHVDAGCENVSADPGDVRPTYAHGTFIAGIIAARANNAIGIAGVAPGVTILPIRAGDCHGVYIRSEARGIEDAIALGAKVINLSIGQEDCAAPPDYLLQAITDAENAGALVVAAAGNSDRNCLSAPANVPNVVAVAATTADERRRAAFSDWGDGTPGAPAVTIAAPGMGISGTLPVGDGTTPLYASEDGTSFAAPIVAGTAALLLSQNPWLSPAQVRQILASSALPLADGGAPGWSGSGLLQINGALQQVPQAISGTIAVNGQAPAAGTEVDATIDGVACGSTQSYATSGGGEGYLLYVPPASVQAGCGRGGATVTISVGGRAIGTAPWSPTITPLDLRAGGS
jgi:subtilisin family serine protease